MYVSDSFFSMERSGSTIFISSVAFWYVHAFPCTVPYFVPCSYSVCVILFASLVKPRPLTHGKVANPRYIYKVDIFSEI